MTRPVEARVMHEKESASREPDRSAAAERDGSRPASAVAALARSYRLIAELLLHPAERDGDAVEAVRRDLPETIRDPLGRFLADPAGRSPDEYVHTLELSPPCPLYLGAYLFDEPETCRGAAISERNAYMRDLSGLYRHFGFELEGRELPDFLPAVAEFLGLSLRREARRGESLRRVLLEEYVVPALPHLREKLAEYGSPYAALVEALEALVSLDLERLKDVSPWRPERPVLSRSGAVCRDRLAVRLPMAPSAAPAGVACDSSRRERSEAPRSEE